MNGPHPFDLFRQWFDEAHGAGIPLPNATALSTVGREGAPSSRMVLLSSYDHRGFVFHTNYESRKGREIAHSPRASLLFWWPTLDRQVRIEGTVEKTGPEESDAYFEQRPRGSRLGAWASEQSRPLPSPEGLKSRVRELGEKYAEIPIPRPPHWGGYRLVPGMFEFWTARRDRLHDRLRFRITARGWEADRLYP